MLVESGKFYRKTEHGTVLQVQAERDGVLAGYDVRGLLHFKAPPDTHHHGLEPCGANDWKAAREAYLQEQSASKKKRKKVRVARSKETKDEEEAKETEDGAE